MSTNVQVSSVQPQSRPVPGRWIQGGNPDRYWSYALSRVQDLKESCMISMKSSAQLTPEEKTRIQRQLDSLNLALYGEVTFPNPQELSLPFQWKEHVTYRVRYLKKQQASGEVPLLLEKDHASLFEVDPFSLQLVLWEGKKDKWFEERNRLSDMTRESRRNLTKFVGELLSHPTAYSEKYVKTGFNDRKKELDDIISLASQVNQFGFYVQIMEQVLLAATLRPQGNP